MLTIFTVPKPFRGHIEIIQRNAIQSWIKLNHQCEVILFGDEYGTNKVASEFGILHVPQVNLNEYNTPLVNSVFNSAQSMAKYPILCYVNTDIIFLSDFIRAVQTISQAMSRFLIVGQRWDLDLRDSLDFNKTNWEQNIRTAVVKHGKLHDIQGIDYFVFTNGLWGEIPPLSVGRAAWDNWMIYRARTLGIPVVDATQVTTVIHQNHDYSHHIKGRKGVYRGVEAKRNVKLIGGIYHAFNIRDSSHLLTSKGIKRATGIKYFRWRVERIPELSPQLIPIAQLIKAIQIVRTSLLMLGVKLKDLATGVKV